MFDTIRADEKTKELKERSDYMEPIIKNDDINVRTNRELHKKALSILNDLSLDMTTAINIYLKQIVIHQGLPFEISLQDKRKNWLDCLAASLERSHSDIETKQTISAEKLKNKYEAKRKALLVSGN
jgi:addiction module RelB/DinJ family antitoxin